MECCDRLNILFYQIFAGHKEIVELFLAKGANVNQVGQDGHSPLMCAVVNGDLK